MSLKKYYDILGLPVTASQTEVRKRYRSLVMRLHPDKNPSSQAKEQFIRVTEAYEIILGKKEVKKSVSPQKTRGKTNEDRVKEAKRRYEDQKRREAIENERYYQSLIHGKKWKLIQLNALFGIIFSIILIADQFLPSIYEDDRVEAYSIDVYRAAKGKSISLIRTKNGNDIWVENINFTLYAYYPEIYIERSRILRDPIHVISKQKTRNVYFNSYYTFYSAVIPALIIFLFPAFTVYYKRRTILFTIFWHISLYLTGAALVFFLLHNNHIIHLLTFGKF